MVQEVGVVKSIFNMMEDPLFPNHMITKNTNDLEICK